MLRASLANQVTWSDLPAGTLRVVVFGPGRGEAIVVILPDETVGVVDGCREPRNPKTGAGDPVREFLATRRPDMDLAFVCLTHPHNDHYAGLGYLMAHHGGRIAEIWDCVPLPMSPTSAFYENLVEWLRIFHEGDAMPDSRDVTGLVRYHNEVVKLMGSAEYKPLVPGCTLLAKLAGGSPFSILACGPSGNDFRLALSNLASDLSNADEPGRTRVFEPNLLSGALLVSWGNSRVLLAGDLLNGHSDLSGWRCCAKAVPPGQIQVVNVAHHASAEAHHHPLWESMEPQLAIVTPFQNGATTSDGKGYPPRPEQIAHLLKETHVAITSPPDWVVDPSTPRPVTRLFPVDPARPLTSPAPLRTAPLRSCVAVALDDKGSIVELVVGGDADLYRV